MRKQCKSQRKNAKQSTSETEMKSLAISHGPSLVHSPDAPKTLPDCLYEQPDNPRTGGLFTVHEDGSAEFQSYPALLMEARQLLGSI